jgi:hypothetical protein
MKFEILKDISKFTILEAYARQPRCSKFDREYMKFDKEFATFCAFDNFLPKNIQVMQDAGRTEWIKWLKDNNFIAGGEKTRDELYTAWMEDTDGCPFCEAIHGCTPEVNLDDFFTGDVTVEYRCYKCGNLWTEEWSCDSTDFE